MTMTRAVLGALVFGALLAPPVEAQDRAGVERAALDYIEGFYEGSEEKLLRSLHTDLNKFGFAPRSPDAEYQRYPMTFDEALAYARNVRESGNHPGPDAPKEVEILDVMDQMAAAKVTAWWGMDYLLMARYDGEWKIVQVLWQSPPEG